MSLDATPSPQDIRPADPTLLPPAEAVIPSGQLLQIQGSQVWTWVSPQAIRPLPGFGSWLTAMSEDIAAIDCLVIVFEKNPTFSKDGKLVLALPGDPPRYLTFAMERREGEAAPAARQKDEFSCLLLRRTSLTAHPVFIKAAEVPISERTKGLI